MKHVPFSRPRNTMLMFCVCVLTAFGSVTMPGDFSSPCWEGGSVQSVIDIADTIDPWVALEERFAQSLAFQGEDAFSLPQLKKTINQLKNDEPLLRSRRLSMNFEKIALADQGYYFIPLSGILGLQSMPDYKMEREAMKLFAKRYGHGFDSDQLSALIEIVKGASEPTKCLLLFALNDVGSLSVTEWLNVLTMWQIAGLLDASSDALKSYLSGPAGFGVTKESLWVEFDYARNRRAGQDEKNAEYHELLKTYVACPGLPRYVCAVTGSVDAQSQAAVLTQILVECDAWPLDSDIAEGMILVLAIMYEESFRKAQIHHQEGVDKKWRKYIDSIIGESGL